MTHDSKHASRREFLKSSASTAGGIALAGGLSLARSAHAAGDDTIKVALIGCGGRGAGAAAQCLDADENVKLVAVADVFEDQARRSLGHLKKGHSDRIDVAEDRIFSGMDAYQQAIDSGVDLVLLATPPAFRPMQYAAAVKAGKHVFMEKPCCTDAPGFRSLMETNKLAETKDLKVVVGMQRRHQPNYVETIKRIHDGAIGELKYLRAHWNDSGIWVRPRKPEWTEMEYQIRNWNVFMWLSGDHIVEQHVHNLDVVNWAKGGHPVEANGMGGRQVRKGKNNGHIFDHHTVEFTYADGTRMLSQCRQMAGCWGSLAEHACGTKGYADCAGHISGGNEWNFDGPNVNGWANEHVDLIRAIRQGEKLHDGWHGATSTMTGILGRMATYSGQAVRWDDAVAKGPSEMPQTFALDADPPVMPDDDGNYESSVPIPGIYKPY